MKARKTAGQHSCTETAFTELEARQKRHAYARRFCNFHFKTFEIPWTFPSSTGYFKFSSVKQCIRYFEMLDNRLITVLH